MSIQHLTVNAITYSRNEAIEIAKSNGLTNLTPLQTDVSYVFIERPLMDFISTRVVRGNGLFYIEGDLKCQDQKQPSLAQ